MNKTALVAIFLLIGMASFGQRWIKPQRIDTDTVMIKKMARIGTYYLPITSGSAGQVLTTDGGNTVSWADANMAFIGGVISKVPVAGDNITSTTVADWIEKAFYSYVPPTIAIGSSGFYEVGTTNSVTITATIQKKSEPESGFTNGAIVRLTPTPIDSVLTWNGYYSTRAYTATFAPVQGQPATLSMTLKAVQRYDNQGSPTYATTNTNVTLSSGYPYFYGMSTEDMSDGDGIETLTKRVNTSQQCVTTSSVLFDSPSVLKYAYFTIPATCNSVTKILDHNGYDVTSSFSLTTNNVSSDNWTGVSYKIYKSNNPFTTDGTTWTFTFTQQ